jgi:dihydrofolate reductase
VHTAPPLTAKEVPVRKVTATFFMSLDGVVEAPEEWHMPYWSDEMGAVLGEGLAQADTLLFGRKTYEIMAAAWPEREAAGDDAGDEAAFAKTLGDARKIVVSSQGLELTWRHSEQLQGDRVEGITALKDQPGGDIALNGSVSVVRQLLAAGLADELHLFQEPIAVRHGMRLFDEGGTTIPLRLLSSRTFDTGVVHLVYAPA